MGDDKFLKLYEKFPDLLAKESVINCEPGLYLIIEDMLMAIKTHQEMFSARPSSFPAVFYRIEPKHGGIDFDYDGGDEIIDHIVEFTKKISYKTCEVCGGEGELHCSTKWMHWSNKKTLCNKHAVELFYYTIT